MSSAPHRPATSAEPVTSSEYDDAEESPGLLLWQVTNRWQAAQRATLKPFDLTHVQFVLLFGLTWLEAEGPVTQKQLADHVATDPMMTSQVLRTLEGRGLLRRMPHPDDRRARALEVTDAGRALANRAVVAVEACDAAFFGALDGGDGGAGRADSGGGRDAGAEARGDRGGDDLGAAFVRALQLLKTAAFTADS